MSYWKKEEDFFSDIKNTSIFYINDDKTNKNKIDDKKLKSTNQTNSSPWYESDSEEEKEFYSCVNKNNVNNLIENSGKESHLDLMKEIQMQVRSIVGNRYNNEAIEKYYNVFQDAEPEQVASPSIAPKEVSISYAKEQNALRSATTSPQTETENNLLCASTSENTKHKQKKKSESHRRRKNKNAAFPSNTYDVKSHKEFPSL